MNKDEIIKLSYKEFTQWLNSDNHQTLDVDKQEELGKCFWKHNRHTRESIIYDFHKVVLKKDFIFNSIEIFTWIIENTNGKWCFVNSHHYLFENKKDALKFKLMWY